MTDWPLFFLGVMAVALVALAVTQVVISLAVLRTARQITQTVSEVRREVRPLIDKATLVTDEAARLTALAMSQVERVDRAMASLAERVDETIGIVQGAVVGPVRQGMALAAAFRAVIAAFRDWRGQSPGGREDDDPLFVG